MEPIHDQTVLGVIDCCEDPFGTRFDHGQHCRADRIREHLDFFFGHDLHPMDRSLGVNRVERLSTHFVVLTNRSNLGHTLLSEIVDTDHSLSCAGRS